MSPEGRYFTCNTDRQVFQILRRHNGSLQHQPTLEFENRQLTKPKSRKQENRMAAVPQSLTETGRRSSSSSCSVPLSHGRGGAGTSTLSSNLYPSRFPFLIGILSPLHNKVTWCVPDDKRQHRRCNNLRPQPINSRDANPEE